LISGKILLWSEKGIPSSHVQRISLNETMDRERILRKNPKNLMRIYLEGGNVSEVGPTV
jgi:hypothetical protein